MCRLICDVRYSCQHSEPRTDPRTCQFDAQGNRKPIEEDPLCLLGSHCSDFVGGSVRRIQIEDPNRGFCSACFATKTRELCNLSEKAEWHAQRAEEMTAESKSESERRPKLEDKANATVYIAMVSHLALERLEEVSFKDPQMKDHSFDELLQVILDLPAFLDKDALVRKFGQKVEERFDGDSVKMSHFYGISRTAPDNDFGPSFREGLKIPGPW